MSNRYEKPPLIEAVCDFRLDPTSAWDLAIPGLFSERFRELYPTRRQAATIDLAVSGVGNQVEQRLQRQDRLQLYSKDEKDVLQIGAHLLSVNRLAPYKSWEDFEPLILAAFESYLEVAQPKGLARIDLRFINRIGIPKPVVNQEDYFDFYPYLGKKLPQEIGAYLVGVELGFAEGRDRLRLEMQSAISEKPDVNTTILGLDYYCQNPAVLGIAAIREWLAAAHRALDDVFEGCIKDSLRELFVPQKVLK